MTREEAEAYLGRAAGALGARSWGSLLPGHGVKLHGAALRHDESACLESPGKDWRASPFFAPAKRLRRLPAVLLQARRPAMRMMPRGG